MSANKHRQDMPGLGLNSDTYKTCSWQRGCRAGLNHTSKSHGLLFLWTPSARLVLPQKYVLSASSCCFLMQAQGGLSYSGVKVRG